MDDSQSLAHTFARFMLYVQTEPQPHDLNECLNERDRQNDNKIDDPHVRAWLDR